jgi:hypothetical protein
LPCDATSSPVARIAQPVVSLPTVSAKPGSSAGATICSGSKHEPSWTAMNDTPALESRRVRTQPSTTTRLPTAT